MIKGLIFEIDGVLVDTKDIHFQALNEALLKVNAKKIISFEDHSKNFDGLPTSKKLHILQKRSWIKKNQHNKIKILKTRINQKF